jgi:hypothetical protein
MILSRNPSGDHFAPQHESAKLWVRHATPDDRRNGTRPRVRRSRSVYTASVVIFELGYFVCNLVFIERMFGGLFFYDD